MTWEMLTVCGILAGMFVALIVGGDKLDHWTFKGAAPGRIDPPLKVHGMTLRQIRKLRDYYVSQTGDRFLENL